MSSDKQLAANRANATRSTGPRTPEGKARASQNAVKHGLAREHVFVGGSFAITTIEDPTAIDRLRADLIAVYQPANSQELFAVERISLAQHNLLRIARLEAGLATTALNKITIKRDERAQSVPLYGELYEDSDEVQAQNYYLAHGFHLMNRENSAPWTLFLRYQNQAERHYRRAVEDLKRLQALRRDLPNGPIFDVELKENAATSPLQNEPISESTDVNGCVNHHDVVDHVANDPGVFDQDVSGHLLTRRPPDEPERDTPPHDASPRNCSLATQAPSSPPSTLRRLMADGREEREQTQKRLEQEKWEDREDRVNHSHEDQWEPERVDS